MKTIKLLIFYIFLLAVTCFAYQGLSKTYFRQDEWASLGLVLGPGPFYFLSKLTLADIATGAVRPVGTIVSNLFYAFFPFNIYPFIYYGMFVHPLNALLVFIIAKKMKAGTYVSILASLLFVSSFTISQAITWLAAPVNTLGATLFLLLSVVYVLKYAEDQHQKNLWVSYVFLFVSILFKESGLVGIGILPIVYLLFSKRNKYPRLIPIFSPLIVFLGLVLTVRIPLLLQTKIAGFATHAPNAFSNMLLHAVFYPFTSFSQLFIPRQLLFRIASDYQVNNYRFLTQTIMQSSILENVTSDLISLMATLVILVFCFVVAVKVSAIRKILLFGMVFSMVSFLPYIVVNRGTSYLDSRYYYLGMTGGSIMLSMVFYGLWQIRKSLFPVLLCAVSIYMYKNIVFIQRDIQSLQLDTRIQTKLLSDITSMFPDIGSKPIFYITGNKSYWGVDNLHVPLQAGPGYILMVLYNRRGLMVPELLRDFFLFDVHDQGYKDTSDGNGFGYYFDYNSLLADYKRGAFTNQQIHALYYDGNAYTLSDITNSTRERLIQ